MRLASSLASLGGKALYNEAVTCVGWVLPYFLYKGIRKKKTEKTTPLIDSKYDEIYVVCEKANGLLAK